MSFLRKAVMLLNREFPTETLIKRGMRVGKDFNRQQGCFLDPTHCFLITIGDDVTMSIRVTVMAHDASTKKTLGYTKNRAGAYRKPCFYRSQYNHPARGYHWRLCGNRSG